MEDKIIFDNLKEKRQVIFTAVLLIVLSNPFFFWWINGSIVLSWISVVLFGWLFYINKGVMSEGDKNVRILFMFTVLFYILSSIIKGSITPFGILDALPNFLLVFVLCGHPLFNKKVYCYFTTFFAVLLACSIIAQVLFLFGKLPSIGTLNLPGQDRVYTIYPFLTKEQIVNIYSLKGTRFSGAYDEPGVIGSIAAILLCVNQFKLKNWKNVIFMVAGLMSMSLAFYVILCVYSLLYVVTVKKNIVASIIIILSLGLFYNYTNGNPIYEELIWNRLEWNADEGKLAGDDRLIGDGEAYYESHIKGTPAFWFGVSDNTEFWNAAEGSASYKVVIAQNGFIFLFFYLFSFILLAFYHKTNKIEIIIFITLIVANTIQRPGIYAPIWVFLYAYYARQDYSKQINA